MVFMNGNNFLLRFMWFVKCWSHVISHYPMKFDECRTFGIGDVRFHICHETTYNHVTRDFTELVVTSHVKTETNHVTIVSSEHCGWCLLLVSHHHFKFSRIWPRRSWNITFFICHVTSHDHMNTRTCDS